MAKKKISCVWGKLVCTLPAVLSLAACGASARVPPPTLEAPPSSPSGDSPLAFIRAADPTASEGYFQANRRLFDYDQSAPLDIEERSRRTEDGLTIVDLTYASPMGGRVPAALMIPDGKGPFAGLVMQRSTEIEFAMQYARFGAVVLFVDAPSFRPQPDGAAPRGILTFTPQDRQEQIQLIIDLRRAVDLLLARPDVDPQRIAYLGVSYGGAMGGLLAALEHRLQAFVLIVGDGGWVTHQSNPALRGMSPADFYETYRDWIEAMWPLEPIHYVSHAAPAPILFQNATRDEYSLAQDALRYQAAGSEPKDVMWYDSNHWPLPQAVVRDGARWLQQYIGPGPLYLLPAPDYRASALMLDRALLVVLFFALAFSIWGVRRFAGRRGRISQ